MFLLEVQGPLSHQLRQYAFGLKMVNFDTHALHFKFEGADLLSVLFPSQKFLIDDKDFDLFESTSRLICPTNYIKTELPVEPVRMVLSGDWEDARYWRESAATLRNQYRLDAASKLPSTNLAQNSNHCESAVVDLRSGHAAVSVEFLHEALAALRESRPELEVVVVCTEERNVRDVWQLPGEVQTLQIDDAENEVSILRLLASFSFHVVTNCELSMWAAILGSESPRNVVAPMVLRAQPQNSIAPVWPEDWRVLPPRIIQPYTKPISAIAGAVAQKRPIRVGVSGCYESMTKQGHLFRIKSVANGHNSLKPWCDLHAYGQLNGMEFVTLDQVADVRTDIDALVLLDRPKADNTLSAVALQADILKILIIYECPLIKPDNWDQAYHAQFDYVFTWGDGLVDGRRYIKNNFVSDLGLPHDFRILQAAFAQRKLLTMINSAVLLADAEKFPTQLYTHRIRAIRWFEANAKDDFDLYGLGWSHDAFPSFRGSVSDKLATLTHYRFALVYENAQGYAGYISEKIQDCLLAGVVPVYGGAPNIGQWIPPDCYIDINQFKTFDDLYAFLRDMSAETHGGYLQRIHSFLSGADAYPFSTECFVSTLTQYLAWGVQNKRQESFEGLGMVASGSSHYLYQEPQSLKLALKPHPNVAREVPASRSVQARSKLRELAAPNLVVSVGFGTELPVFSRARALWDFYASHFPGVHVVFMRDSLELPIGETRMIGGDLVIGIGGSSWDRGRDANDGGYGATGVWSKSQNERTIYRQMALYRYLMSARSDHFHLFATTVTSVVDFRGLLTLLPLMPQSNCFAGLPGTLQHEPYKGIGLVHGANTLVSRDVMGKMLDRYVPDHIDVQQPNDHWQGIVLQDVPRTTLPLFSFNEARRVGSSLDDVFTLTQKLLADGHYHFRVKTSSAQAGVELREDVDPWIMLSVMRAILGHIPNESSTIDLQRRFDVACTPGSTFPRDFPVDDSETKHFYRM